MASVQPLRQVYQLHIQLEHIEPPIWRRLLIDSRLGLTELHTAIQAVMGWYDSHLHEFGFRDHRYGIPDEDNELGLLDERKYRIDQLLKKPQDTLEYLYDYGDYWQHRVTLEAIKPWDLKVAVPRCIDGGRACPPEDCGGPPGYAELLEIMADPAHPEHQETLEILGDEFEPDSFDVQYANEDLASMWS